MQTKATTLAGALIAGLLTGSIALAESNPSPQPSGIPSGTPAKRKPHKGIKNKMACCKNGCDCMDAPKGESKQPPPKKSDN
jgi:hypothetical protein